MVRLKANTLTEVIVSMLIIGILVAVLLRFLPSVQGLIYPIQKTQIATRVDSLFTAIENDEVVLPNQNIKQVNYSVDFEAINENQALRKVMITAELNDEIVISKDKIIRIES